MSRPLRIEFPGAHYHVMSRGNARQLVFLDDTDHHAYLDLLGECCVRFDWHCHAFCLMPNHVHLLLETRAANLSRGMRHLNGVFTQRYNERRERVGHLFQGRYKALLVDHDAYLIGLVRYILRNPLEAGLVADPARWRWSSYAWSAGMRSAPAWATPDALWRALGADPASATQNLAALVMRESDADEPDWEAGDVLGSTAFKSHLRPLLERKRDMRDTRVPSRFADRPPLASLLPAVAGRHDDASIASAVLRWGYLQIEVARHLGMSRTKVWRIVARSA